MFSPSVIISIIVLLILIPCAIAGLSYAPWVPTKRKDLQRILRLSNVKKGDVFFELGSGDGRVSSFIAKHSQATIIGIERAFPLFLVSRFRAMFLGETQKRLHFRWNDFFKVDLSDADVIFTFGMPQHLAGKLKRKLEKELKKGTRVLSYVFHIDGWEPICKDKPKNEREAGIYVYEM